MRAIEFVTKAKDGVIKIPKEYLNNLHHEIRVIILINPDSEIKAINKTKAPRFTALKITTKGFNFDRDEANKR